ncbi:hypothetical protein OSB04_un001381 [Centaurea solstitialis]|uniref:No apical meristem-associated C-terminal domain-containing protein n=1 Tax=Centaurea solstitialis TaxID=347529 RepID=A0AA38S4F5_9ASTR|nr:hypothetical protein OSB04_un001381 [Centaurea solstitialis]
MNPNNTSRGAGCSRGRGSRGTGRLRGGSRAQFWKAIERSFYERLGTTPYRTYHQMSTKWAALTKKILIFNVIYNNIMNIRPSGQRDLELLQTAHSRYQALEKHVFPHEDAWEILRHCRKWATVLLMSGSSSRSTKHTRKSGSSDAHFGGDDDEVHKEIPQPQRPIGRGKEKKATRSKGW